MMHCYGLVVFNFEIHVFIIRQTVLNAQKLQVISYLTLFNIQNNCFN